MKIKMSKKLANIKPSATLVISANAAKLKEQGKKIIDLSLGEPDFDSPKIVKEAAIKAINEGKAKYTQVDGTLAIKSAIIKKFKNDNDLEYTPDQIIVSTGAKQSIYNALQATLDPGDEVIIPAPYWVSYPQMVILSGGTPVFIETDIEQDFKITPAQLEEKITPKTKLIMLNSPSNPTGRIYSSQELSDLAKVLEKYPEILILSDDIYEYIIWNGEFSNIVMAAPKLKDRVIIINGVSKAYAMTGWRIGYAAAHPDIVKGMKIIQSQSTSSPNSIGQEAATAALTLTKNDIEDMVQKFKDRHDYVFEKLSAIPGIKIHPSDGTFYILPNIEQIIAKCNFNDDIEFCSKLLDQTGLALVPGSNFGANGCVRISIASSLEELKDAVNILHSFCTNY